MPALHTLRATAAVAAVVVSTLTVAARAEPSPRADRLSDQIMSPFCPGKTLSTCTSPNAARWRSDIRGWVDEGVPSQEIQARLEQRAGRSLRTTPTGGHTSLILALSTVLGLAMLGALARITLRSPAPDPPVVDEPDEAADARLDEELALLD